MSRYENRQELAEKIDCEGGIFDMLFGYGLTKDDLPQDDTELLTAWDVLAEMLKPFEALVVQFEELLPEPWL